MTTKEKIDPCTTVVRKHPDLIVNKEIAREIGLDYRTLPIFEKGLFEYTYKKHYSLQTNEFLKCRWEKYKREFEERVFAPFQFLDIRDYHFYNYRTCLNPTLSVHTKTEFRRALKPGPGIDQKGEIPIPQELLMKRVGPTVVKKGGGKKEKENEKEKKEKENHGRKL